MAKSQKAIKPLVEVMHDYADSLKAQQDAASMLYSQVSTLLNMKVEGAIHSSVRPMLQEAADNYRRAMYGEN